MGDIATPTVASATGDQSQEAAAADKDADAQGLLDDRRQGTRKPAGHSGLYPPRSSGRSARMIGEVVVDLGLSDRETVEAGVAAAREQGRPTGVVLVERGILRHDQLARVVAERFGLDFVDLTVYDLDMGAVSLISIQTAKRYQAVPVGFTDDGSVLLAMANPTNVLTIDDVGMMTGRRIRPAAASVEDLNLLLARLARMDDSIEDIVDEDAEQEQAERELSMDEGDSDAPVIKLVHSIVAQAIQQGASDIHVNPEEGDTKVLFRVDGVLAPAATVKRRMAMGVVSRIKILADLDISERRVPQDGRFALTVDGRRVDIRVVTLPLVNGEGVVMRILDKGSLTVDALESIGMREQELERFSSAIQRPNGAVLVTGPTGSGKSTTLYAALHALNDGERSILTIEDPVETRIAGIKQMQIAPKAGVTFDVGLRSMLRADPDVIMVGEIRDAETAHIAVEAAMTGHLVLSTLHTRDAPSALGRLDRHGHRAVPRLLRCRLHRRPAPRAHAVHALQASAEGLRGGARRTRAGGRRALRARRLLALRRLGLPWAAGPVRGDDRQRADPRADTRALLRRSDGRGCALRRHAPTARRRPAQGPRGTHLDRRDRADDQQPAVGRRASRGGLVLLLGVVLLLALLFLLVLGFGLGAACRGDFGGLFDDGAVLAGDDSGHFELLPA